MKKTTLFLAVALGTFSATAQDSATTLENDVETVAPAATENPWEISTSLAYNTNIDEVQESVEDPFHSDRFYNTVGVSKRFMLGNMGTFQTTLTPNVSATFVNTSAEEGKDSDDLKAADINSTLSFMTTSGNLEYGMDLTAGYHYGYTYKYRNGLGDGVERAYRRNDNKASAGITLNGNVAVTSNYKINNSIGFTYEDAIGARVPHFADYVAVRGLDGLAPNVGKTYDRNIITAGIDNQIIINDNLTISIPLNFQRLDYQEFQALNNASDGLPNLGKTRMLDSITAGLMANVTVADLQFSTGFNSGRLDDKRSSNGGEDSDYNLIKTTAQYNFTETFAMSASHQYEEWRYDVKPDEADERYNTYTFGVSLSNVAGLPMDAGLNHRLAKGQSQFATGIYENNATSLDLNFRL